MLRFHLYRIKTYITGQGRLYEDKRHPPDLLRQVIDSLSTSKSSRGTIWHIGDVSAISSDALYLRIGRITKSRVGVYEPGHFIDKEFEQAPYTHVIVDVSLGLCAIAKNTQVSSEPAAIARQFARLLNRDPLTSLLEVRKFEIDELQDPDEFIISRRWPRS